MLAAEGCQDILLRVVQVRLDIEPWVVFFVRDVCCTQVDAIPFLSKLDEYPPRKTIDKR